MIPISGNMIPYDKNYEIADRHIFLKAGEYRINNSYGTWKDLSVGQQDHWRDHIALPYAIV